MKEIEILVNFDNSKEEVLEILKSFEKVNKKRIVDVYYYDELRNNLKPEKDTRVNEIFRLRKKDDVSILTYKKNYFDDKTWLYSDEYETTIGEYEVLENIISMLGLKELIKLDNTRTTYKYDKYEIVLDELNEVGIFLEVEVMANPEEDHIKIKKDIYNFIKSLGLKNLRVLNVGKNQMLLRKKMGFENIFTYIDLDNL